MGKQQFIIPAENELDSISKPKFVIPKEDEISSILSQKKNLNQNATELSGAKPLSDTKEEEGMFSKALTAIPRFIKALGQGYQNANIDTGIEMARELTVNLMPDKFFAPKKMSFEEKLKAYDTSFAPMIEGQKTAIKGSANIVDENGFRLPDAEALGAALGGQLLQMQRNTNIGGMVLNHLSATESNYEEARQRGIDPQKAYLMSHALGLTETLIDKYSGIDGRVGKFVAGKLGKAASDEAIDQIVKLGIKSDAFEEAVKTSGGFLKNLLTKGVAPEFISEGIQQVITTGEKQLFDIYQKATNQVNEGDINKKGQYGADLFSMNTVRDIANSSFMGGLVGGLGYTFTASGDFNPTIYATLQREYNENGKDGLGKAIENVKTGITKASEAGKLTPDQVNAAVQNVDKIANNVSSFEQNSKIDPYSRYSLFNVEENLIPMVSNGLSKDLAQMATPLEMPTTQQIDDDIAQGNVTPVSFDQVSDIPDSYRNFAAVADDQNGNKVIQFQVPNSIVKAHTDNQMAVQTLMNNPLFAIKSLSENNKLITIEDLENVGLGGGEVFPSSASQLQFKVKFEQNRPQLINGLKTINYLKSVSNQVKETGKATDPVAFSKAINNITNFNTGDTVFFNDKAHKITGTSPDGQMLNLSGVKEQVNASDENIKTQREIDEAAAEPVVATTEEPTTQAEPTQGEPVANAPIAEEQPLEPAQKTINDAVYELTPFVYQGKTGRLRQQSNGVVMFETKDRDYELGNISDIGGMALAEWDIVQQEMSTDKGFNVTIDGKTFTNKNQNPFAAITYDENGNPVSVKLQDEKGKTKVIKGTRALLIDAQYKERKILNESTDEQLNEVEQQVTAGTENIGNAEPTTVGGQVKPVEPAFTEKQRERQRTINDVAKRLAQETENTKNTKAAIANITSSLFKAGIKVEVLTSAQIKEKYNDGNTSQGFFIAKDGTIVINQNIIDNEWGKTIVFHEGTHPIINIIRNTDPKTFKQLIDAIRDMRSTNTTINSIIKSIEANPTYKGKFTQNDEIVVETIARIASGKLKLNDLPVTLSQKIKDLINKIGRALGFKQVIRDNNDVAFVRLANQISEVLNTGRDISEIVGENNITSFQTIPSKYKINGNDATVAEVQFSVNNSVEDVENEIESIYLKDNDEFKGLVDRRIITNDKTIEDFEGVHMVLHQPDAAFSGEIYKNIKTKKGIIKVLLIEGSGGIFFPIKFYKEGLVWASTKDGLDAFFKSLMDSYKKNNGKVYIGLTTAPSDKMLSSTTMAQGTIDLFESKVLDKKYAFTDKNLKDAIINGYLYEKEKEGKTLLGSKDNSELSQLKKMTEGELIAFKKERLSQLKKMSKEELIAFTKERLLPNNSVFPERKNFTVGMLNHIALMSSQNKDMAEQLGEFFHISINNEFYKGKYNIGYKLSKDNLVQAVSHMFAEPMLRLRTKEDADKGGSLYAIIEVDGEIESIDSKHHKSYSQAVKAKNGEGAVKLHILQNRYQWNDVMLDNETSEHPSKDRIASIYPPSSGITFSSLKVGKPLAQKSDTIIDTNNIIGAINDMQFSNIDREPRLAPNGNPSNLTQGQYNQVRTPEFKAWFGDWENDPKNASKIVDENGEPMVMYHGTSKDKDFDSFKISDRGAWFSSSPEEASSYASSNDSQKMKYDDASRKYITTNTSSRVIPVFLNIKNLVNQEDVDKNIQDEYRKIGNKSYRNGQKYLFNQIRYKDRSVEGFAFDRKSAGAAYDYAQVVVLFDGKTLQDGQYYRFISNQPNIKSAVGNSGKFSPVNPKIQMSDLDRTYTPESTVAEAGMTIAEREAWREKNKVSQKQKRIPVVMQGSRDLYNGDITFDSYVNKVRDNMPIMPFINVPKLPSLKEIISALNEDKLTSGGIVGVNKTFVDGERVASRLDIPAYENYDTWVVSIHDSAKERILGYGQTAVLKNVQFKTSPKIGLSIAANATFLNDMDKESKGKATIARIHGDWVNESPEATHKRATELMNDPAWTQVGMNPFRHSFFYDKSTGEALIGAEEVIQVGALVLAKNVQRAPFGSQAFNDNFTFKNKLGEQIQFSEMSRDDSRINALRDEYYNNNVLPDVLIEAAKKEYGLDQAATEMLVSKAIGSVLDLKPYESNNKAELSDEQMPTEVESILEKYTQGYEKDKTDKLKQESKKKTFADYAVQLYDSKFKIRRILQSLSDVQTLSSARLRNIMGKAKASSMEAQQAIAEIYGGLGEKQIKALDELIFALRVIQLDKNNSEKVYIEYDRLRKQFIRENNGKLPNEKDLERLMEDARKSVPEINHGLLDSRLLYTAKTAQNLIDALRGAYSTEDFDNLMSRAAAYKRVGNESITKMQEAGHLSKEVADKYKDDFYTFRKTLERYYDDYSSNVPIYYKDGVAYYSAFKSLGEGSKDSYFQRDSRVLLAENILIVNKAIAKNNLRKSIFDDIMSNPKDFFTNADSKQSVILDKNGADLSFAFKPAVYERTKDGNVKQEASGYVAKPASEGFVNVPFRVDGKLQYFQMQKDLYDEVEGLNSVFNPQDSGGIVMKYYDVSNAANIMLTATQTRYSPFFFWRNMSMDIRHQVHFTDYWTSDKNFLKSNVYSAYARLLFASIKNTKKIISNDEDMLKLMDEATKVGLFMDTYSEAKEQVKRSSEIDVESLLLNKQSKWESVKKGFGYMNVKTEIAMRISAYEQAKKHLTEQYKKLNNVTELNDAQVEEINEIASAQARGYTDFAQKGTFTPHLNFAYLNASIQGLGSALEYSYDNPAKTLRKSSELFIGHILWTTMLMMAIPDLYDELDEYTKDVHLLSPMGFMKDKLLDSLGLPSFFIPTSKIDPTLVPLMGVARRTAEHFVKNMRGEQAEPLTYEEVARLINIALPSIFSIPEKTAPVDAAADWGSKILSGSALLSGGTKLFFGYDAFRGQDVDAKGFQKSSNLLDGMHNPDIPYIYKIFAKASALATEDPNKMLSPARINAAAESIIGSPKSSFLTGILTAVTSDIANLIIPASEIERSDITLFNPKNILKSFGVLTDSGLKERLQNRKFLEESGKLNLKAADIETIADKNIDLFYKQNPATFMSRVEKYSQEWDYTGDEDATDRLIKKAELKFNKLENKSGIPKDISTEVKIIYYTKGSDNQAKMLKSIAGEDKKMANKILESLSGFGMDEGKVIEIEEKYYKK